MFQQIMVPLDTSPRAELALPLAAQIARASGGSILLLQVVSPLIDFSVSSRGASPPTSSTNSASFRRLYPVTASRQSAY